MSEQRRIWDGSEPAALGGAERIGTDCLGLSVCPECQTSFRPYKRAEGRQVYCTTTCRARAWKRTNGPPPMTRRDRVLARLVHGPATGLELLRAGGGTRYGQRIAELREEGHRILGPRPWRRLDGTIETETVPLTEDGWPVYRLRGSRVLR